MSYNCNETFTFQAASPKLIATSQFNAVLPMLDWFRALMPKEDRFFELFNRHAAVLVQGAEALRETMKGGEAIPGGCAKVIRHEMEADEITRDVIQAVRRTFITPFDRSDITDLISSMDDAIDQMRQTAKTVLLFEISGFEPLMQELGEVIVKTSSLIEDVVKLLSDMKRETSRLHSLTEEVRHLEERSDELHDQGLKALLQRYGKSDPMAYIMGAAIYEHLEKVVDRFEDVANRINDIVIEHV